MKTEARDKSVKIRIVSKKGKSREDTRRELMEMPADEIDKLFESYDFRDLLDHKVDPQRCFPGVAQRSRSREVIA